MQILFSEKVKIFLISDLIPLSKSPLCKKANIKNTIYEL